ncbi:hypothetical protein JW756_05940 [Candidatus Woesearchaeota archaeon]|nr:hypothetical protein [Candidatus Woesearchaeota archaeon]
MACFLAPASVAIITTVFRKKFSKAWHINWLNTMIWGGTIGLAVEHIAHQEIVPWFPFLSAMSNHADTMVMLKEIASVGIPMTLALVFVWAVMVVVYEKAITSSRSPIKNALQ